MYHIEQFTHVGFSGAYADHIEGINRIIEDTPYAYYTKVTDETGKIIREIRKPFFVRRAEILRDNCTGETFWSAKCFETEAEAKASCPGQPIIELHNKLDYLDI